MYVMDLGKINGVDYYIVCDTKKTRNGFRHEATLVGGYGTTMATEKINYINRTWESWRYESVINLLLKKLEKGEYYKNLVKKLRKRVEQKRWVW